MNASQFHTSENKVVNAQQGPCWYCGMKVRAGQGFGGKGRDAVWHDRCGGTDLRRGRDRFYDSEGFFKHGKVTCIVNGEPVTTYGLKHPKYNQGASMATEFINVNKKGFIVRRVMEDEVLETMDAAWEKAEGLARENDAARFFILELKGSCSVEKPVVRRSND